MRDLQPATTWPGMPHPHPCAEVALTELAERLNAAMPTHIGFPAATHIDWTPLLPLLGRLLNNVGASDDDGVFAAHTKPMEREVISTMAGLFRATGPVRGYVTPGATEGTLWALMQARTRHPDIVAYHSTAAHYSVGKAARLLGLPTVAVRADDTGEIDYEDLRRELNRRADRPAAVIATVGTTMTEACDDVRLIAAVLEDVAAPGRWIHADAALAGVPLALLDPATRPGLDFADGADSIVVSGHKFLATPMSCAVVLARHATPGPHVPYIDAHDETVAGSRDGHASLALWWALRTLGPDGLRRRAQRSRIVAEYACRRLHEWGWTAFRTHPHTFTVVLKAVPEPIADRWQLPTEGGWSHLICMPGIERRTIDAFVSELGRAAGIPHPGARRPTRGKTRTQAGRRAPAREVSGDAAA